MRRRKIGKGDKRNCTMTPEAKTGSWGSFALPVRIEHHVDFGDREPGGLFGYFYNYFDYFFLDDQGKERRIARSYLDEVSSVSLVNVPGELDSEWVQDILCYLFLRFKQILVYAEDGYVPLDQRVAVIVGSRVQDFIANSIETA
jgi:hypothetical protein